MTSLLSAISGQFSRSLLLSTLLPVAVFVLLALVLVWPQVPGTAPVVAWAGGLDPEWKLAAVTLAVVLLTALLHNLNGAIVRFYEGYPWCESWLGRWRAGIHRRQLESREKQWRGLRVLLRQAQTKALADFGKAEDYWNQLGRELNTLYPDGPGLVLPTRLGNVIRSFESYPWRQYRMRSITAWPRLIAKIDGEYAVQIDEAKSSVDFMLNGSVLCALLALLVAGIHLAYPVGLASPAVLVPVAAEVVALLVLSYGFYLVAISRADAWGAVVKGAFDLYRRDLLAALGYQQEPKTLDEERDLWEWISSRLILTDLTVLPHPGFEEAAAPSAPATSARGEPAEVALEVARGVALPALGRGMKITVRVRNADPARAAADVTIAETLPPGWLYEWDSAHRDAGAVEVSGINPYRFRVGDLAPGEEALLTYRIVPRSR